MSEHDGEISQRLLAHRGYAAAYPENTLAAIDAALDAGARLIEFDVQLTRDRVPVLLHDADFLRTAGRPEIVFDTDAATVCQIEVSEPDRFGSQFAGTTVPTLEQVLQRFAEFPDATAFIEIKRHSIERFGVAAVLDAMLPIMDPVLDQCVLISFNEPVLVAASSRRELPVGWALRRYDEAAHVQAIELAPDYLFCNQTRLPPLTRPLWKGPWQWIVYEIVDRDVAQQLFARGVSIVETMAYPELAEALTERAGGG